MFIYINNKQHTSSLKTLFCWSTIIVFYLLWQNYNKSRIHSFRGVRDIEITLDGNVIFKGEIQRACGGIMGGSEAFGDVSVRLLCQILFIT